jgi:hypothetical protein
MQPTFDEQAAASIQLIDRRSAGIAPAITLSPMQELQMQIVRTGDLEKLKELRAIEREWKADHAKEAYNEAMAQFKAMPLSIRKNKHVSFDTRDGGGKVDYWHATLASICEQACPLLASVGLRHNWAIIEGQNGALSVTCTLTHALGHSESVTLSGMPDASGKKNPLQQKGSTVSYLERYTFLAIAGLATIDQDNDGRNVTPAEAESRMDERQAADYRASIDGSGSLAELEKNYLAAKDAADKARDLVAAKEFKDAANAMHKKLSAKAVR